MRFNAGRKTKASKRCHSLSWQGIFASVLIALAFPVLSQAQDRNAPAAATVDASQFPTLQAALDSLPESGGIVKLPPGTFEISQPLVVSTPETRLEGAGASTHIKNLNATGEPCLVIRPANRAENAKARLWRVQLGNFRLSGNEKSGDGVRAEGVNEIFIHGLSVDHHGGHGIALIDCYEDPRISDSIITYNRQAGLHIKSGHDIVVNGNHFEENLDAVQCLDSFNLCMNGNNLDDHLRHGVVIENTYGSVVSGNMIEECNGTAIILDRDCYGITLSANVIAHHLEGGIDLRDAHGCAVSANTFTLVHRFSVRVGPGSGRIAISGNSFCNSEAGGGTIIRKLKDENPLQIDMGTGVVIEGGSHVNVSGNTFSGLHGAAVTADAATKSLLINGNIATDLHRGGDKNAPAFAVPEGNGNRIGENLAD